MARQNLPLTSFGGRLQTWRQKRKLSQVQLAELAGCSQAVVSKHEGDASPTVTIGLTVAYAAALNINAHWLATGEGEPDRPGVISDLDAALLALVVDVCVELGVTVGPAKLKQLIAFAHRDARRMGISENEVQEHFRDRLERELSLMGG